MSGRSPRWFDGIQYPYESNFADNTWAQIIAVCQKGVVPATWKVGDQKAMTIDGTEYIINIIGILHDDYADGSGKAPLTFQLHDRYGTNYAMNSSNTNAGGWGECQMRTTHLPEVLALMPSEVQAAIREVNKLTSAGSKSATIETTADKLFLPSEIEIFGTTTYSFDGEGTQYAYYSSGGISSISANMKLRSPRSTASGTFVVARASGTPYYVNASTKNSIAPAFCF